jgi:hypothetical protein
VETGKTLVLAPTLYLIGYNDDHTPRTDTAYHWTVTGGTYDTTQAHDGEFFVFTPGDAGTYTVRVRVEGRSYIDGARIARTAETEAVSFAPGTAGEKKAWGKGSNIKTLRNFAPGQFTESGNGYGWSLGAIGGYFVQSLTDKEAASGVVDGGGNAFGTWFEPGVGWLQEDNNGNGVPDEMWYEVKGASDMDEVSRSLITRRYAITWAFMEMDAGPVVNEYGQTIYPVCWVDCKGRSGRMGAGWPKDWGVEGDWVTYTCTIIGDDGDIANGHYSGKALHQRMVFDQAAGHYWGYADTHYTYFHVDTAMDAAGNPVTLNNVRFLKVQTAEFRYGGVFGELSTETGRLD